MAATEVIVDTGPLVAYFNRRDKHHDWAVERWAALFDPVLTCESVISEAAFLLHEDGLDVARLWGRWSAACCGSNSILPCTKRTYSGCCASIETSP